MLMSRVGTIFEDEEAFARLNAAIASEPIGEYEPCDYCKRAAIRSGMCRLHLERKRRYGDPLAEPKIKPVTCQAEGCQRKCEALGLCPAHRHRFARGTAPELKPIVDRFRVYGRSVECGNA